MGSRTWIRNFVSIAAGSSPIMVVGLSNMLTRWQPAVPDVFVPGAMDVQSATGAASSLTGSLTGSLPSLAVGIPIGIGLCLKEGGRTPGRVLVAAIGCCAAIASIYAAYRFQSALAEQLAVYRLDLDRIRDRIDTQAWTLLLAGSCVTGLFADMFAPAAGAADRPPPARPRRVRRMPRRGGRAE